MSDLDKGNRDAAQQVLENMLGINFSNFQRTVVLSEETARNFVSTTPTKRRQIIEDLLGFGILESYEIHARKLLKNIKIKILLLEKQIENQKENLENYHRKLNNSEEYLRQPEETKKEIIEKIDKLDNYCQFLEENHQKKIQKLKEKLEEDKTKSILATNILQYRNLLQIYQNKYSESSVTTKGLEIELMKILTSVNTSKIHFLIHQLEKEIGTQNEFILNQLKQLHNLPELRINGENENLSTINKKIEENQEKLNKIINSIKEQVNYEDNFTITKTQEENKQSLEKQIEEQMKYQSNLETEKNEQIHNFLQQIRESDENMKIYSLQYSDIYCQALIKQERATSESLEILLHDQVPFVQFELFFSRY